MSCFQKHAQALQTTANCVLEKPKNQQQQPSTNSDEDKNVDDVQSVFNTYVLAERKSTHPNPDHYISGCTNAI